MNYYKIFLQHNFIGMINSNNFYKYNNYNHLFYPVDENHAQCIWYNEHMYRIFEMQPLPPDFIDYDIIELIPATETEYEQYKQSIEINQPIEVVYPEGSEDTNKPDQESPPQPQSQPESESVQPKMTIQEMRDKITEQEQQIQLLTNYILELN